MAIVVDAISGSSTDSGTSLTFSHTCTGSNLVLIVGGSTNDAPTKWSATYNGVAMTRMTSSVSGNKNSVLFYLVNPATGTHDVVISEADAAQLTVTSVSYSGVSQVSFPDSSNTGSQTNVSSTSVSTTVVANNCWTVATFAFGNNNNNTISSSATIRGSRKGDSSIVGYCFADSNGTVGTGSQSISCDPLAASINFSDIILSMAPAPSTNTNFLMMF